MRAGLELGWSAVGYDAALVQQNHSIGDQKRAGKLMGYDDHGDPERFNVRVRLDGLSPIGEMDMSRQASYVSARAATIGCLLDVASRVKSGPIEVTSLVRHLGYQQQLRATNVNATDDVPTHALGM